MNDLVPKIKTANVLSSMSPRPSRSERRQDKPKFGRERDLEGFGWEARADPRRLNFTTEYI